MFDDAPSEDEQEYDLSTLSDYMWLIGKVPQDSDDKKIVNNKGGY